MDRKELLKKAEELGLEFPKNIPTESLHNLVNESLTENGSKVVKAEIVETPREKAIKLKRVIITPIANHVKNLPSEYFFVGNPHIGFIKKVVPFNVETFQEQIIIDNIKEKRDLISQNKIVNGRDVPVTRIGPAYSVQELPDLTEEELREKGIIK